MVTFEHPLSDYSTTPYSKFSARRDLASIFDRYNTGLNDGLEGKVVHFALIDLVWRQLSLGCSIPLHALMG